MHRRLAFCPSALRDSDLEARQENHLLSLESEIVRLSKDWNSCHSCHIHLFLEESHLFFKDFQ